MQKTLVSVAESKLGFSFAPPQRIDKDSLSVIVPILRETSIKRNYLTFPETDKVLVFDTGKIDEMEADNQTDDNVFVRSGTLFRGQTQERALQRSFVLFPHKKVRMPVRCIHATRGISPNAKTTYGGITPLDFDQKVYSHGYTPGDQGKYWHAASSTSSAYCASMNPGTTASSHLHEHHGHHQRIVSRHSMDDGSWLQSRLASAEQMDMHSHAQAAHGMDDLAKHMDDFAAHFDDILSKVELKPTQAGLALLTDKGVETVELFDHKDSWKALHDSAVKRLGSHVIPKDEQNVFEYKPEVALRKVQEVLGLDWETNVIYDHRPSNGEPSVLISGISHGNFVGEITEIDGNMAHAVILRKAA